MIEDKKITRFDDFFPEEIYNELVGTAKFLLKNGTMAFSTNAYWDRKIVKDSFPVLIHEIHKNSELFVKTKEQVESKTNFSLNEHDIMFYYWTRFSYIPWHRDQSYAAALTVYLNEEWHEDWGGYFLYEKENNDIGAIQPKRNLGLLQQGGVKHSTTSVHYNGNMRITVQVFLDKREKNA